MKTEVSDTFSSLLFFFFQPYSRGSNLSKGGQGSAPWEMVRNVDSLAPLGAGTSESAMQ